ncbi:hypothetical protein AKJ62_01255 [candidate division MSBL1 archaeon SCGC-AAA259D14]|uniref:Transposase IS4-like domain-containing protein n=1 Tax=candidate division MSBL1 archaeon SCGC-AAA259D14 TaxID=1698261 RepID=A0A133U7U6_9EURY|nr:hypothetical protein AKJ62_01255 [candidate division MSBL1 archaeon SCGC-AAA259D14]
MKYVPKGEWPEWIRNQLGEGKNYEVRESNGNYYLYRYENVWDKENKRPKKKTEYVGSLKRNGRSVFEHGHVAFLIDLLSRHNVVESLRKHFPDHWEELLVFSMNRVVRPFPLKRVGSWMEKTSLGEFLEIDPPSGKKLSKVLGEVGVDVKSQSEFMRELIRDDEMLLYDGSMIYSTSNYNKLLEVGYDKDELFLPKVNIALLFSKDRNMPIHLRIFFGSVHEIKTIEAVIREIKDKDILFIADKGFYKNDLYDDLDEGNVKFVLPLPRDDDRIQYDEDLSEVFKYRDRIIKSTSYPAGTYHLYHYEDQVLKHTETKNYYKLKLDGKDVSFNESWAGKIALLSNQKLDPEEAYLIWKNRGRIEKAFDVLQNLLETDRPYISSEEVFRGYLFASFISLTTYYIVLNFLQEHEVNNRVSVKDVLFEFSKIRIEDRGYSAFSEIPKKVRELAEELKVENIMHKIWES